MSSRYVRRVIPRALPPVERKGLPWELALLGACRARARGWTETGLRILLMFDCLLRGEDAEQLRVCDVVEVRTTSEHRVVLRLGSALVRAPTRGAVIQRTKTGPDAGVIVQRDFIADAVATHVVLNVAQNGTACVHSTMMAARRRLLIS